MESHETINDLITRYFNNEASISDKDTLMTWLEESPKNAKEFERLQALWILSSAIRTDDEETNIALKRFRKRVAKPETPIYMLVLSKVPVFVRYAAVVLLAVSITLWFSEKPIKNTGITGAYFETYVPIKQKSQITLPDGTKIWLNSDTRIRYAANFGQEEIREVFLSGEAYFEVAKNPDQPFYVHTDKLDVNVTGTIFNLRCYPDDENVETALVEGKVTLVNVEGNEDEEYELKPNQRAVFRKSAQNVKIENLKTGKDDMPLPGKNVSKDLSQHIEAIVSWKDEKLVFENEPFPMLVTRLERWFNVKISVMDEELKKSHYTGKFINNETLEQVLNVIGETAEVKIEQKNNEITIKPFNQKRMKHN